MDLDLQLWNLFFTFIQSSTAWVILAILIVAWGLWVYNWAIRMKKEPRLSDKEIAFGSCFRAIGFILVFTFGMAINTSGPRVVLDPPQREAVQPRGEVVPYQDPATTPEEREQQMRELDNETDDRTVNTRE